MNLFTIIFLLFLSVGIAVQWILVQRHIKHIRIHREQIPSDFSDSISVEEHHKAADYTRAKVKMGLVELIISSVFLLLWTIAGGLQLLDEFWRSFGLSEIVQGTVFILSVFLLLSILDLPLKVYRTFKLEQSFGFNRMTPYLFVRDQMKHFFLGFVLYTPLTVLLLWLMSASGRYGWLYAAISMIIFVLFYTWAYPAFIAPIFNRFIPLENAELQKRIEALLTRNGFKSQGVFVMNGSLRSTHGNAYFAGFGNNKRIVFFDTLIDTLNYNEIEAVLAHELGHFKRNHVKKLTLLQTIIIFTGFAMLGWLMEKPWFYSGLGVEYVSDHMALILFLLITPVFTLLIMPFIKKLVRKYEFEADDFAVTQVNTNDLIHALVTLYKENANTVTPDPLYSAFHDSHPPAPVRIAHLRSKLA